MQTKKNIQKFISLALSPPLFAAYASVIFSFATENILASLLPSLLFLCLIPIIVVFYFSKRFKTSLDMPEKENRNLCYFLVVLSYIVSSIFFYFTNNHLMFLISLAYATVTTACAVINLFCKISAHTAGIVGPVTALVYVFGLNFSFLYILAIPIIWVRLKMKIHNIKQIILGLIIGITVTYLTYIILY